MTKALWSSLSALALLAIPASAQNQGESLANPLSAFAKPGERNNWHIEVEKTERGHLIGNPDAEAKLILFTSYTCEECAQFEREGGGGLDLALLAPGLMSVEVRPIIQNNVDLTIALLAGCGGMDGFRNRHRLFLMGQDRWLPKLQRAPHSQRIYWEQETSRARLSLAATLDLDDMLANRGVSRSEINRCLRDEASVQALIESAGADEKEFAPANAPSFALNGETLEGVHDWDALYAVLSGQFRPEPEQ